jgi:AraC-like DNA-binding protein
LGELVASALPTDKHQSNKRLFLLARGIKALEKRLGREYSQTELRKIVDEWCEGATPFLREGQSRDDYWFEFLYGYERVKCPLGEEVITRAWTRAKKLAPPKIAGRFEQEKVRQLVALCRELQQIAGDESFYLSCRTVARLFHHETHTTAARWLRGLRHSKIIRVTEQGGPETNKASRYKYLHPLDE